MGRNTYKQNDLFLQQQSTAFRKAYDEVFQDLTNEGVADLFGCTLSMMHRYKSGRSVMPPPLLFEHMDLPSVRRFVAIFQRELWNL